jgi:membrane-associated PAP2 superfamily phosphatase
MNRTGLLIALGIAAVVGLLFGIFPELDLMISRPFYEIVSGGNSFGMRIDPVVMGLRQSGMWLVAALVAPAVLALAMKLLLPRKRLLVSARAILFLTTTLMLGPGLVTNLVLKDYWGRSRPIDVTQLGGQERFVAWWDPRGVCPTNCSFVSGDIAAAYWTLAPAALAPPAWRPLAYGAALAFGAGMTALRVAAGGHFLTDGVFAGVFTFLIIWVVHGLIYRWPKTRLTDAQVEGAIERMVTRGHGWLRGLAARRRTADPDRPSGTRPS